MMGWGTGGGTSAGAGTRPTVRLRAMVVRWRGREPLPSQAMNGKGTRPGAQGHAPRAHAPADSANSWSVRRASEQRACRTELSGACPPDCDFTSPVLR